ncbi:MAG: outer membrane beta-barrel protein [Ferrimonas sp.]
MKKILLVAAMASTLSIPAVAQDLALSPYGVSFNYFNLKNNFEFEPHARTNSDAFSIQFHWEMNQAVSFHLGYQFESIGSGAELHSVVTGLSHEWRFDNAFAPYVSAAVNAGVITDDGHVGPNDVSTVWTTKVGAGLGYYIQPDWRINLGGEYQYRTWNADDASNRDTGLVWTVGIKKRF